MLPSYSQKAMDSEIHAYRSLQPQQDPIQHGQPHLGHHALSSQGGLDLNLSGLDENVFQHDLRMPNPESHAFAPNPFEERPNGHQQLPQQLPQQLHIPNNDDLHTPQLNNNGGQFGILTTNPIQHSAIARVQNHDDLFGSPDGVDKSNGWRDGADQKSNGHLSNKMIQNPPNLAEWRQRLFDVDETIILSKDDFETYFPHVDNVYSHRSTQNYKRKPFVSHYWDCRLKGRPPGTPKSDDPNKKKRKRTARERDLCDVKIKITEYFPGAMLRPGFEQEGDGPVQDPSEGNNFFSPGQPGGPSVQAQSQFGMSVVNPSLPPNHPGANGDRYYTIQRVNGNGGNGKGDGIPGPHKHDLAESDRVKKNSVQRHFMKKDKEDKKSQKTYHKKATGSALMTVRKHIKESDFKLFGSCFCPFVQRVWIALEIKSLQYQYIEVDHYKKPQALTDVNPLGLLPTIAHGTWACNESTVLMEYLDEIGVGLPLLPLGDPQLRATCRLWADHINRKIVPAFYNLLTAQDYMKQSEGTKRLQEEITKIVEVSDHHGPYFLGSQISYVDVQFAPWMLRFSRVLKHYRHWQDPHPGSRWAQWINAIETNEHIRNTTSGDELYIDSYERYAQNRINPSELTDAINGGFSLP